MKNDEHNDETHDAQTLENDEQTVKTNENHENNGK